MATLTREIGKKAADVPDAAAAAGDESAGVNLSAATDARGLETLLTNAAQTAAQTATPRVDSPNSTSRLLAASRSGVEKPSVHEL